MFCFAQKWQFFWKVGKILETECFLNARTFIMVHEHVKLHSILFDLFNFTRNHKQRPIHSISWHVGGYVCVYVCMLFNCFQPILPFFNRFINFQLLCIVAYAKIFSVSCMQDFCVYSCIYIQYASVYDIWDSQVSL